MVVDESPLTFLFRPDELELLVRGSPVSIIICMKHIMMYLKCSCFYIYHWLYNKLVGLLLKIERIAGINNYWNPLIMLIVIKSIHNKCVIHLHFH